MWSPSCYKNMKTDLLLTLLDPIIVYIILWLLLLSLHHVFLFCFTRRRANNILDEVAIAFTVSFIELKAWLSGNRVPIFHPATRHVARTLKHRYICPAITYFSLLTVHITYTIVDIHTWFACRLLMYGFGFVPVWSCVFVCIDAIQMDIQPFPAWVRENRHMIPQQMLKRKHTLRTLYKVINSYLTKQRRATYAMYEWGLSTFSLVLLLYHTMCLNMYIDLHNKERSCMSRGERLLFGLPHDFFGLNISNTRYDIFGLNNSNTRYDFFGLNISNTRYDFFGLNMPNTTSY